MGKIMRKLNLSNTSAKFFTFVKFFFTKLFHLSMWWRNLTNRNVISERILCTNLSCWKNLKPFFWSIFNIRGTFSPPQSISNFDGIVNYRSYTLAILPRMVLFERMIKGRNQLFCYKMQDKSCYLNIMQNSHRCQADLLSTVNYASWWKTLASIYHELT